MTEPSLTADYKVLVERHGNIKLALAGLRHYWKLITGTAGVILSFGIFLDKFNTVIKGQEAMLARVGQLEKAQTIYQAKDDARWEAIHAAADIVVTAKQPAAVIQPPQNAPAQEVRKGQVTR